MKANDHAVAVLDVPPLKSEIVRGAVVDDMRMVSARRASCVSGVCSSHHQPPSFVKEIDEDLASGGSSGW